MQKRIFFVDRFVPYSVNLFESLSQYCVKENLCDMIFLGPDVNFAHKHAQLSVKNSKRVWSYGHFLKNLYKYIKNQNPNIVHFAFEPRTFGTTTAALKLPILLFLLNMRGTKIILTLRNIFVFKEKDKWRYPDYIPIKMPKIILKIIIFIFIKTMCKFSNIVVAETNEMKSGLIEYFGINNEKIEVIPAIGLSSKSTVINKEKKQKFLDLLEGKKLILCFGVISPRKGQHNTIKAFKMNHNKLSNYKIIIAGLSSELFRNYENRLHELVKESKLENDVIFAGLIDNEEIDILFDMAEMAIFPYRQTSASTGAISHAIKFQVPSIVSTISAFVDVFSNNVVFVEPDNITQLSNEMVKLAEDDELKKQLSEKLKPLQDKYDWKIIAEKYGTVYKQILNK